jgi:hypothetical protein
MLVLFIKIWAVEVELTIIADCEKELMLAKYYAMRLR